MNKDEKNNSCQKPVISSKDIEIDYNLSNKKNLFH